MLYVRVCTGHSKSEFIGLAIRGVAQRDRGDRGLSVLELGCGMGGDLKKWFDNGHGVGE